jgi:hypothetical protein
MGFHAIRRRRSEGSRSVRAAPVITPVAAILFGAAAADRGGRRGVEGVQRIVLAAPRPESVGEPEEVFHVDCFENRRDRLLDDFVLQAQNAQQIYPSRQLMAACASS